MIFTEADVALAQLAHDTLAKVVAEKRANREFLPPAIDEKVTAIGTLVGKMRDANVKLTAGDDTSRLLLKEMTASQRLAIGKLTYAVNEAQALRAERDELLGRLQAAQQAPAYDPEPDRMLDWIERESWADVRYAIAPAQREEYGSLRDAIRHAQRSLHASR